MLLTGIFLSEKSWAWGAGELGKRTRQARRFRPPKFDREGANSEERTAIDRAELPSLLREQRAQNPTEISTSLARAISLYDYATYGLGARTDVPFDLSQPPDHTCIGD